MSQKVFHLPWEESVKKIKRYIFLNLTRCECLCHVHVDLEKLLKSANNSWRVSRLENSKSLARSFEVSRSSETTTLPCDSRVRRHRHFLPHANGNAGSRRESRSRRAGHGVRTLSNEPRSVVRSFAFPAIRFVARQSARHVRVDLLDFRDR